MQCLACGHGNRSNASFCEECGSLLPRYCPRCGGELSEGMRFCATCGRRVAPEPVRAGSIHGAVEGERRQATVLFSDLSGYTLIGAHLDPEELDRRVARIKNEAVRTVERHGGIVSQFRGDEILALFGVVVAHDDDAVRAVRAALDLHTMIRTIDPDIERLTGTPLRLHSGISTGLVVSSGCDPRDGSVGVTGDAVNLGARLVARAGADEILVGEETRRQIHEFFETTRLDSITLKGRVDPVVAFRVEGETAVRTRFDAAAQRGFTRFAGRESELATLRSCLGRAISGRGGFVTITGEPGVGKSRLAFEFSHRIERDAVTILEGRCQSSGMSTPYLPFMDTIRKHLRLEVGDGLVSLHDRVVAGISDVDRRLTAYLPYYLHLLSIPSQIHALPTGLEGLELRRKVEEALLRFLTATSQRKPVLWIVDDWHWADDASIAALSRLFTSLPGFPLLVVVLYRPEYSRPWIEVEHHTPMTLPPLDVRDTELVIRAVLSASTMPDDFAALVHERTGGNPFFIEEIAAALVERGHVVVADGRVTIAGLLETLDLPETVQSTIRARVDCLDREARETLRVASVLGREFDLRILAQMLRAGERLVGTLERLGAQELVQSVHRSPVPEYRFKHMLTRMVVYETLLHQQRRALHGRAGHAIEILFQGRLEEHYEALAHHYAHSADRLSAVRYLELAGDKAARVFSLSEARSQYQRAIDLLDEGEKSTDDLKLRVDISLKLAKASHYATSSTTLRTLEVAREYAHRLDDRQRLARVAYWLGGVYRMLGNHPRVFSVLGECLQLAQVLGDEELQAYAFHVMGRACYLTGEYAKGIDYMSRAIAISERRSDLLEVSYSYGFSADCLAWLGDFDEAFRLVERSMTLAVESGDLNRQGGSNWYLAAVCCMHGDWGRGMEAGTRCVDFARRTGGAYLVGAGLSAQGWAAFHLSGPDRGIDLMREGLETMERSGSLQGTGLYASWLADSCANAGRSEEAVHYAEKALDFHEKFSEGNGVAPAHRALAIAAVRRRSPDWNSAYRHLESSVSAALQRGERPQLAITLLRRAELMKDRGDRDDLQASLAASRQLFLEMRMAWWVEEADRLSRDVPQP